MIINGKEVILQEDIKILKMYATNKGVSKYIKQKLTKLKGEINKFTIEVGDFNPPHSVVGRISTQKISQAIEELNNIIHQLDQLDI